MKTQSFEAALKQLEEIVKDLENGELPLEKALEKFEKGVQLSRHCSKILEETEKRVTILMRDHAGEIVEKPFSPENDPVRE